MTSSSTGTGSGSPDDAVQRAYAAAEARYVAANPGSRAAHARASASLPGGNTRSVLHHAPWPLCAASGAGCRLTDVDGHEYADFLGEYSAGLYGHSHPVLLGAVREALEGGLGFGAPHRGEERLARVVRGRFGGCLGQGGLIRFTNSGTEAMLMCLALVKGWAEREGRAGRGIVVFRGGYHGGGFTFKAAAGEDGRSAVNVPHDWLVGTYNDAASVEALIEGHGAGNVAAVVVEPMLGSGGGVKATREFLAYLRRRTSEIGALLVFDEVMTSRLYDGRGVQGEMGIYPDLTTLGKYMGGGMSFGAFGGRADVMKLFDPREGGALPHAGTFNNNVLTMRAGAAGLEEVFTPARARELHENGEELRRRINGLADGTLMKVVGCGSIMCFHMTRTPAENIRSPADWDGEDKRLLDLLHLELLNEGFYIARRGYVSLSIVLGTEELDGFVSAVGRFLDRFRDLIKE
ncbi:class III aminotransferase [Xylariaceae sp. FL0016]|nr:class III aminotransferase [Xylariaceae sp. FL0016]